MNWIWILCSFISHLSHSVHSGSIWMNIVAWRCRRTVVRSEVPILIKRCWTLYGRGLNCGRSVSGLFYLFLFIFFGWFSLVLINSHFIQSAYFWHVSGIWTRNLLFTSVKCSELYLFCIEVHPVNSHCGGKLDFPLFLKCLPVAQVSERKLKPRVQNQKHEVSLHELLMQEIRSTDPVKLLSSCQRRRPRKGPVVCVCVSVPISVSHAAFD